MKKIIYTRPDGGLSVMAPAKGAQLVRAVIFDDAPVPGAESPLDPSMPLDRVTQMLSDVAKFTPVFAETEDEFVARIRAKDVPALATDVQIIASAQIPTDRTFRNAWKSGIGLVEYDLQKCRDIWRNRMREARAPKLAVLDTEYLRADERGDLAEKQRIATEKQKLRDITANSAIEAAQTPEELKNIWPQVLRTTS